MSYRRMWPIIVSGFFEPLFYLLSLGFGLGTLRRRGRDRRRSDRLRDLRRARPARRVGDERRLLRRDEHLLEAPLPEALRRDPLDAARAEGHRGGRGRRGRSSAACSTRSASSRVITVLGLVESWWALLALPATVFVGFAFAGAGVAAVTYMRSWQDFDILNLAILPMFLFSATFFPLSTYPDWLETVDPADAALPRRRPAPRAHDRDGRLGPARERRLSDRARPRRHLDREPARREAAAHLERVCAPRP